MSIDQTEMSLAMMEAINEDAVEAALIRKTSAQGRRSSFEADAVVRCAFFGRNVHLRMLGSHACSLEALAYV
jgi:hypothetical protein